MSFRLMVKLSVMLFAVVAICLAVQSPAFAQGCAMCKASVANSAQAKAQIAAFKNGTLALLIPPVGMMCAILGLAYKRRGAGSDEDIENSETSNVDWDLE